MVRLVRELFTGIVSAIDALDDRIARRVFADHGEERTARGPRGRRPLGGRQRCRIRNERGTGHRGRVGRRSPQVGQQRVDRPIRRGMDRSGISPVLGARPSDEDAYAQRAGHQPTRYPAPIRRDRDHIHLRVETTP